MLYHESNALFLTLILCFVPGSQSFLTSHTLIRIDERLWLIPEHRPEQLSPESIHALYELLHEALIPCQPNPDSVLPIVIHFVPQNPVQPYPEGTSGFAGVVDTVTALCLSAMNAPAERQTCTFIDSDEGPGEHVLLIVIALQDDIRQTIGYLAHELAHGCGAVDGPNCPADPRYREGGPLIDDICDCYWWFGVHGFFTMQPAGLLWDALNDECSTSTDPVLCISFADLFGRMLTE